MPAADVENATPPGRSGSDRLLFLLKTGGEQTAAELGRAIGTTGENARQQLTKLAAEGLVETQSVAKGVGRPSQFWRLTAQGHGRFPDAHAELTVSLIRHISDLLGPEALERLIAAREEEMRVAYRRELGGVEGPAARIAALAGIRSREGYMAEQRPAEDGSWLLIENHCPICAAATACQGFCRSELAIFREMLGPHCSVERTEHIVHGARRCAYRIRQEGA